jgi:flagellar basal body-associated protein FliL
MLKSGRKIFWIALIVALIVTAIAYMAFVIWQKNTSYGPFEPIKATDCEWPAHADPTQFGNP